MAFPASPSNNDVHKEGNRAFVYDSALGVWDQVRETDRTENKILTGEIGSGVTFPAGHVIQTKVKTINLINNDSNYFSTTSSDGTVINVNSQNLEVTGFSMAAGNLLKVDFSAGMIDEGTGSANGTWGVKVDAQVHMTNFKKAQQFQTLTTNWAKVISGGLSNKTVAAVMASSTSSSVRIYCHEYTSYSSSIWSITVQEIQM